MNRILILASFVFFLFVNIDIIGQTKIICSEKEMKKKDAVDPVLVKTCLMGNYKSVSIGESDFKGRYSYEYKLYKKVNGQYVNIKNSELFNSSQNQLISIINQRIKKEFNDLSKDPENKDCLEGFELPNYAIDELGITFNDTGIEFNVTFGLSSACMSLDGTIVAFTLNEIQGFFE